MYLTNKYTVLGIELHRSVKQLFTIPLHTESIKNSAHEMMAKPHRLPSDSLLPNTLVNHVQIFKLQSTEKEKTEATLFRKFHFPYRLSLPILYYLTSFIDSPFVFKVC